MFGLRALMVMLGFFGAVYCLLSLAVACVWRGAASLRRNRCQNSAIGRPRLLFALRVFPLVGSAFLTLAFALPAFLRLESGAMDEDPGTLLFSTCTLLLLAAGWLRVAAAQARASRVVADWLEGEPAPDADRSSTPPARQVPPLLLYGVSTPRVLASDMAVALLSPDELRVAVQHEVGHIRSRDNLKKLLFCATAFPGMATLEQAWQNAAEFAADEAAVGNRDDAVDLASALIKLADLVPLQDLPAFTTGLVNCTELVRLRVERLLDWDEPSSRTAHEHWWFFVVPLALGTVSYTVVHYGQTLLFTHRFTEWLIH
jgi:Zn-dependent protease with chaperone function